MSNEVLLSSLKMFGRFPKSNFSFDSEDFIAEYKQILSSEKLIGVLLARMAKRYANNEIEKQTVLYIAKNLNLQNINEDRLCEMLGCDKNLIYLIGKDLDVSIRLFAQKRLYLREGKNEEMIDEFGLTPKTFNYLYKRGYNTKTAIIQAYKNGYINSDKIKSEIKDIFFPQKEEGQSQIEKEN